jgi:hypothetical protein
MFMQRPVLVLIGLVCVTAVDAADDPVIARLRQNGDHAAVERYARERLKTPGLGAEQRGELVAELAGSLAQQANAGGDAARVEKLWREADQLLAEFIKENPRLPRVPMLTRQRVIYGYAFGESLRVAADFTQDPQVLQQARTLLQQAAGLAAQLDQLIRQLLDAYNAKTNRLDFKDLTALSNDVPYRQGLIHMSLARTYARESAEQKRLLTDAAKYFDFYTREGYSDNEIVVRSHLGLAECRRLLKDYAAAERALSPIEQSSTISLSLRDEALAIRMKMLLDQGYSAAALALLRGRPVETAELAAAEIHVLLLESVRLRTAGSREQSAKAQAAALDAIAAGERRHGPHWLRRAERLLAAHADPGLLGYTLPHATRLAEALRREGQFSKAMQAYSRAAERAEVEKQTAAFDLRLLEVEMLARSGNGPLAAERYRRLLATVPTPQKGAEACSRAWQVLTELGQMNNAPELLQAGRGMLEENIRRFPRQASFARLRLADHEAEDANWRACLEHCKAIPPEDEAFGAAIDRFARAYDHLRRQADRDEEARLTREGLAYLDACQPRLASSPQAATAGKRLARARAQLLLWPGASEADFREAHRTIENRLRELEPDASAEALRLRGLNVLALFGMGRVDEAVKQVTDPDKLDRRELHALFRHWRQRLPESRRRDAAALQLAIVRHVLAENRTPGPSQLALRLDEATTLADLGQGDEARLQFAQLRREHPRDAALAEANARVLMQLGLPRDFTDASGLWQALGATHKEGTEPWFEAKYQLAVCYARCGQKERGIKVLKLTLDLWLSEATTNVMLQRQRERYQMLMRSLEAR